MCHSPLLPVVAAIWSFYFSSLYKIYTSLACKKVLCVVRNFLHPAITQHAKQQWWLFSLLPTVLSPLLVSINAIMVTNAPCINFCVGILLFWADWIVFLYVLATPQCSSHQFCCLFIDLDGSNCCCVGFVYMEYDFLTCGGRFDGALVLLVNDYTFGNKNSTCCWLYHHVHG